MKRASCGTPVCLRVNGVTYVKRSRVWRYYSLCNAKSMTQHGLPIHGRWPSRDCPSLSGSSCS